MGLDQRLAQLPADRRALLQKLLREKSGARAGAREIARRTGDGPAPLTFAQQRLWFLDQIEPGSPTYTMLTTLRLRGRLDAAALRRSFTELERRHEVLRTVFEDRDGEPVQRVRPPAPASLAGVDLRALPGARAEEEARRLAAAEALRPFDLSRGPLLRSTLLRLGEEEQVLVSAMHHIVSDGWSMGVLVRELSALYDAFARGGEPRLPELPVQYADYAAWQREQLTGEVLERQLAYWRERLAGALPVLDLPLDRRPDAGRGARAGRHEIVLPDGVAQALRAVSRREEATPFMVFLAAWTALLARYGGETDVVVGTPVAGRGRVELEGLVGLFANMLALRADLSGDPAFPELVGRVREMTLGAFSHQDVPLERLVDELGVERSLTHTPLFQVTFAFRQEGDGGRRGLALGGVEVEPFGVGSADIPFRLDLSVVDGGGGTTVVLAYQRALFEAETAARMLGHFGTLLEAVAAGPGRRLSELPLLAPAERERVLAESAGPRREHPAATVHGLVAAQAERTPRAVAVVCGGERLTYAELDARANRLASHLRGLGVGPETRVGVCLERTPELVVALLGVLGAGGAYVPLDPAYPRERLGWMLEDARVSLVLTSEALAGVLPAGARALALDGARAVIDAEPDEAPRTGVLPENLSHVIFTSGSTGRPKGVMIRHASAVGLLRWLREVVSDEERGAALFSTSISFDVSVAEVFGTLAWGGRLVMVENALGLATVRERVVHASMVPSAAAELLRTGGIPASVRTMNLGGEPLPPDLARALHALGTVEKVGNLYGPTEDTTYSTYSPVAPGSERVLVGRPAANTRALVLDDRLEPVPAGLPGELYLAGEGLARGYASRPDLTAERFLPDPFGPAGSRMYRVMDRVRRTADGELEYLGRTDFQVKVRGFRIELGEVEAALRLHPGVRDAVAAVREDGAPGAPVDRRLAAYVVAPPGGAMPAAAELRAHLRARLPEYMVPAAFVEMEAIPLTPSGKTDRRALPDPGRPPAGGAYLAPRDLLELEVARAWEDVLGGGAVGVRSDFFELGGHSLLAVRMLARVERRTGRRLPVAALFAAPTVEGLAAALRREDGGAAASPLVGIRPEGSRPPLFFVHPAGGDVLCYAALARRLGEDQPFYALRARGLAAGESVYPTVEAMADDYLERLRAVRPEGPYRLGGWSMGGAVAFEMARRLAARGEEVDALVLVDSVLPHGAPGPDDLELLAGFALHLDLPLERMEGRAGEVAALEPDARLSRLLEAARAAEVVPADLELADVARLYSVYRANVRALLGYRPAPYPGALVLFRAAPSAGAPHGWEGLALGGVEVEAVPGDHFALLREPHVGTLAAALAARLERSGAGPFPGGAPR